MSSNNLTHAPSRGAYMAAKAAGVQFEVEIVDLFKKEQLKESFLKKNLQHCVPTLEDDGFVLWESRAIASYLVDKYAKDDKFYPKDLQRRAVVNQRLYFDCATFYPRIRAICYPILWLGETEIKESLKKELNISFGHLDQFLGETKWAAGDHPTIADTSLFASVSSILEVGWDISSYPNVQRWVEQCASLPGADENSEGAKMFGAAVRKNLK
ncbi:hypothetical protein O3G_MSEX009607 [Manduca sexta]|uniref:Glutathione S-transferase n=1 Tax=Manduca sexta TaxID=7130 RepID=A0A921ZFZ2_MANSE|nr:hypothetical protein O3G_MSEX009607 [Manduca sexta]KAG6456167.1 hypothetical protein O3G_MSEX009607 [Manduca sexta]